MSATTIEWKIWHILYKYSYILANIQAVHRYRPGKSCKLSSSGKFKALQCPQNSVIDDNGWTEIYVLNVGVAWWNPQILMAYPQFIALHPQFSILNASFSILLPQISLIQPQFCIFGSSSSILSQKNGIFYSKSPQNSVISNKMSASAACTACNFFQVWIIHRKIPEVFQWHVVS